MEWRCWIQDRDLNPVLQAHRGLLAERAHHLPFPGAVAAPLPAGAACLGASAELGANIGSLAAAAAVTSATCGKEYSGNEGGRAAATAL